MLAMHWRNVFEFDALRLLVAVARTGSFTAAAGEFNYTQSAVSRRIATLEQQAGGPLFERLPRGVRLNAAGRALHRYTEEVLERLARAERELAAIHGGYGGSLRLGAFATANVALVPKALRAFRQACPEIEVTPVEGPSGRLIQRLADGDLDLAVISDYPSGLPDTDGVVTTVLIEDELLVALPREHRLAERGIVDLGELRDETWIQNASNGRPTVLEEACARAGFTPRNLIRIFEWTGKFGYVAAGLGVTLVPFLAAQAVPADLVLCRLGDQAPARTVHLARPARPLPAARTLERLLVEAAGRLTTPD